MPAQRRQTLAGCFFCGVLRVCCSALVLVASCSADPSLSAEDWAHSYPCYLPSLGDLSLFNSQVTDLSPLSAMQGLTSLGVSLTDLTALSGLGRLTDLHISPSGTFDLGVPQLVDRVFTPAKPGALRSRTAAAPTHP